MATKTTIEMAREAAGDDWGLFQEYMPEIHRLVELVRADERARMAEQPAQLAWTDKMTIDVPDQELYKAQPEPAQQKPVAWMQNTTAGLYVIDHYDEWHCIPLYTSPQPCPTCEALKLALEALEFNCVMSEDGEDLTPRKIKKAITALREARAEQPKGRPVESDYASQVAYTRALEAYCDGLEEQPAPAQPCVACEGNPQFPNNPCILCGCVAQQPEQQFLAEIAQALGDETITSFSQVATGICDLKERLAEQPAQRTWVGLTDEDIDQCLRISDGSMGRLLSAIEAKLKGKNT